MVNHKFSSGEPSANGAGITIAATATAVPEHIIAREQVKLYLNRVFDLESRRLEAMMNVIDNSQVKQRYCIFPIDYLIEPRPLSKTSLHYQEHAIRLGRQAASDCLQRAGMKPEEIDLLITVSCTGVMIPSLDAHLMNDMGFRPDCRRLPITELGCAAGAASFSRAWEYLLAFPERNVLLIAVELPSLTFQRGDASQANLISCVLFGDGAGAAVVTGRPAAGPKILATDSYLFPNSLEAMGFDLRDTGFHIILSRDVPQLIRDKIKGLMDRFLERHNLTRTDLSAFILHPGGQKLLAYLEEELGLCQCDTEHSWEVLRNYGNLSSATVFFVLDAFLKKRQMAAGKYGVMAAFGPGFSSEMLLLRWA